MLSTLPRKHLYQMVHAVLPTRGVATPEELWADLSGATAQTRLEALWMVAGATLQEADRLPFPEVTVAFHDDLSPPWRVAILGFPEPQATTEPYFVAVAYTAPDLSGRPAALRYFVLEAGTGGGAGTPPAVLAEWDDGERVRLAEVPADLDTFQAVVQQALRPVQIPEGAVESTALDRKPRKGCWFLTIPIFITIAVVIGYIVMFTLGAIGTTATGDRVRIGFSACEAALPMIEARVRHMGLGDPTFEENATGFVLEATLPAAERVAEAIPDTLAKPGRLEVRSEDGVLVDTRGISDAYLTLRALGDPLTVVELDADSTKALREHMAADEHGAVRVLLDGHELAEIPNKNGTSGKIELSSASDQGQVNLDEAAEWAILLAHGELPCPVRHGAVEILEPAR